MKQKLIPGFFAIDENTPETMHVPGTAGSGVRIN